MSKKKNAESSKLSKSTLAALLEEKPKRGRPRSDVPRQNVYVALRQEEKDLMKALVKQLPVQVKRADVADLAISALTGRLEALRQAVAGRSREIPEGVIDMESLYLLWDLNLPDSHSAEKWTSIRVSPQQVIELGRAHGALYAAFGASRSQTFSLALSILAQFLEKNLLADQDLTLEETRQILVFNP
ncbi:MAG: hypothetical protein R3293_24895 [Candidatus Promineifilaceae bacterium]|nr:hypothetical protein [Candidatus Promineifilaceae bacterium]